MKPAKILLLVVAAWCGLSSASAQTWTQTSAPTNYWNSVTSSADGTKLAVAAQFTGSNSSGHIFTSTNSGLTWTEEASPSNCVAIASSADGNKLVAAIPYTPTNGSIFTSADSGITWTSNNAPNVYWDSVASSADGNKLVAAAVNSDLSGMIYISTNSGATWTKQTNGLITNTLFGCVCSSADGVNLLAMESSKIFTSTNSGSTWGQIINPLTNGWGIVSSEQVMAMSSDGARLVAAFVQEGNGDGTPICISTNSGATWALTSAPINNWSSVCMSADGSKLAAVGSGIYGSGPIYTSTNFGVTWTSNNLCARPWTTVAMSADGNKIVAAAGIYPASPIFTSQVTPSPSLNIAPTNGSLALSWIIPSTNFVLQQSSDLSSWAALTNTPVLNLTNLQNQVTLPMTNGSGFYQLKTP